MMHGKPIFTQDNIACVDLFCGAGGLTCGLIESGIPVVAGVDIDIECHFPYEHNNKSRFINQNVSNLNGDDILPLFGQSKYRIIAGCAPCQPFSSYTQRYRTKPHNQWNLLYEFARIVKEISPDIVTMENVPNLVKYQAFSDFVQNLVNSDYFVEYQIVDSSIYGLPQHRRRIVLTASKFGKLKLVDPEIEKKQTVIDAIGNLPPIQHGESHPIDRMHMSSRLSTINLARIDHSVPGGTWRDWPSNLLANCHQKATGESYLSVYGRMQWNVPSPTLTTQFYGYGNGRFGHPEQSRAISLREGAILQGFPQSYLFVPDNGVVRIKSLGRLIGNAVPVTLARIIGKSIIQHFCEHKLI